MANGNYSAEAVSAGSTKKSNMKKATEILAPAKAFINFLEYLQTRKGNELSEYWARISDTHYILFHLQNNENQFFFRIGIGYKTNNGKWSSDTPIHEEIAQNISLGEFFMFFRDETLRKLENRVKNSANYCGEVDDVIKALRILF